MASNLPFSTATQCDDPSLLRMRTAYGVSVSVTGPLQEFSLGNLGDYPVCWAHFTDEIFKAQKTDFKVSNSKTGT